MTCTSNSDTLLSADEVSRSQTVGVVLTYLVEYMHTRRAFFLIFR